MTEVRSVTKRESSEEQAPLPQRLGNWLRTQGYPLEMRVAAAFRNAGFSTYLSGHYADPETETPREIDVVAFKWAEIESTTVQLTVTIECKLSREWPWVLFLGTNEAVIEPRLHPLYTLSSVLGRQFLMRARRRNDFRDATLFAPARTAYGMTQAFTSKHDVTYAAAQSAIKAGIWRTRDADEDSKEYPTIEIVIPIIVVEASLFEYFLDNDGAEILNEVPSGMLLWDRQLTGKHTVLLRLLSIEHLNEFVEQVSNTADYLMGCHKEIEITSKQWWSAYNRANNLEES